jgi:hypothetical protein
MAGNDVFKIVESNISIKMAVARMIGSTFFIWESERACPIN